MRQHAQTEEPRGLSHSESKPIMSMGNRIQEDKAKLKQQMGDEIYDKVHQILMMHK